MPEFQPLLRDKAVLLISSLHTTSQGLATLLTENGADLVIANGDPKSTERFAANLNSARDVHEYFGKVHCQLFSEKEAQDPKVFLAKVTEQLGGLDGIVDNTLGQIAQSIYARSANLNAEDMSRRVFGEALHLAKAGIEIFNARKRGRYVFLTQNPRLMTSVGEAEKIENFEREMVVLAQSFVLQKNVSLNSLQLGATEEFLLAYAREKKSIRASFDELKIQKPTAKFLEPQDIAQVVVFLLSGLSGAISGMSIRAGYYEPIQMPDLPISSPPPSPEIVSN